MKGDRMNRSCRIAIAGVVMVLSLLLAAQEGSPTTQPAGGAQTYKIDPVHSNTLFRIRHMNISNFYGRFNDTRGTIVVDDRDPARCSFETRIAAESIDTHNANRDKDLRSADFFEVAKFPQITFKSTAVKKAGDRAYDVTGDLTLHGVTRPLTLRLEQTGAGPAMKGEYRAGFETTFAIKRSDYGMTQGLTGVGDEVRLTVSVEAVRE
jgi:polyisoprenoid-binding protein YceI